MSTSGGTPTPDTSWCCDGVYDFSGSCPLCPTYGTGNTDPCPGHDLTETNQERVRTARLHAEFRHPKYQYRTTKGPRKQWDDPDQPPVGDDGDPEPGWEPNLDAGLPGMGWERFDYHEEAYWRRPKKQDDAQPLVVDGRNLGGELFINSDQIQAVQIAPPPIIAITGHNGRPIITVHPDGSLEYGDDYTPDKAVRAFWDAVQRFTPPAMVREYGAPLTARINAELAAGQLAHERLTAVTEAVTMWRDRPGGDVGLAIALAGILDTEKPEPPAATALVRVLRECDRLEAAVRDNPQDPDFDGAYLACIRHIRQAAGVLPADEEEN